MSRRSGFDDLARRLAEPMPRGRAVRLAAGALLGLAVPAVTTRPALAGRTRASTCGPSSAPGSVSCDCPAGDGLFFKSCCGPGNKCVCFPDRAECHQIICPTGREWCGAVPCCKPGETCEYDGSRYRCRLCDQGEFPCRKASGTGATQCCRGPYFIGNQMITRGERCEAGKCVARCSPGYVPCGTNRCCPDRWNCCGSECCPPSEKCCDFGCCPKGKVCCSGGGGAGACCDADERCLYERPPGPKSGSIGLPHAVRCVPKCKPSDWCGPQKCCGQGFRCVRKGSTFKCVLSP